MTEVGFLPADGTVVAMAHRGFAPDGAENSMAAFERAVALGYRYLETDVRVTADGVALAFHDSRLDRVTDLHGRLDVQPWTAVRHARIAGREPIPLLTDVLGAWPDVRVNIDIKSDTGVAPTVAAVRATGTLQRVCIGAFSGGRVAAVRRLLGPRLCTSLGPREAFRLRVAPVPRGSFTGRCAQVPARIGRRPLIDARYIRQAHAAGAAVHAWTVNDPAEMTRLLDLGVDGIITDAADVLRTVLAGRGQWPARRSVP